LKKIATSDINKFMAINFDSFSDKSSFSLTDKIVGFDSASPNGEKKWTYNTLLKSVSGDITIVKIQDTAPTSPKRGDLWFNSSSGVTYVYYVDANSSQWIDVGGGDSATELNVQNSPTVSLNYNSTTKVLSADANYLLTLINTLSTNMQNIGNYPYLEYAWVTTLGNTGQLFSADTETPCNLNTEIADTGNNGLLASNQITLKAGTYLIEVFFLLDISAASFADATGWIQNVTNNTRITQFKATGDPNQWLHMTTKTQATFNQQTTIELRGMCTEDAYIRNYIAGSTNWSVAASSQPAQLTTIKLWKVG
jgi:hypothetical protein